LQSFKIRVAIAPLHPGIMVLMAPELHKSASIFKILILVVILLVQKILRNLRPEFRSAFGNPDRGSGEVRIQALEGARDMTCAAVRARDEFSGGKIITR
jgi:hypothetical protein